MITQTSFMGKIIESGFFSPGYWARSSYHVKTKSGFRPIEERGYRSEQQAVNAVKRRIKKGLSEQAGRDMARTWDK